MTTYIGVLPPFNTWEGYVSGRQPRLCWANVWLCRVTISFKTANVTYNDLAPEQKLLLDQKKRELVSFKLLRAFLDRNEFPFRNKLKRYSAYELPTKPVMYDLGLGPRFGLTKSSSCLS